MKILLLTRNASKLEIMPTLESFGEVTVVVDEDNLKKKIDNKKFEICVCYCYGPILSNIIIKTINCKIINLHPSYLPYGRGIYPILWAAYNNQSFGCTIHLIDDNNIDSGPIIIREKYIPERNLNLKQLRCILMNRLIYLLSHNLLKIVRNEFDLIKQEALSNQNHYKNRKQSEDLLKRFEKKWETTIEEIIKHK